jgi:hypothetical protein
MMNWFKNLFKKENPPKPQKFPIGSFIIHIPLFVDNTQVGKIVEYSSFGYPITENFIANGYCIPYSPIAFDAIMSLSPLQRLAILSPHIIPIDEAKVTLNFETLVEQSVSAESIDAANQWYDSLPINRIEVIAEAVETKQVITRKPRKKKVVRQPIAKRVKKQPGIISEPEL